MARNLDRIRSPGALRRNSAARTSPLQTTAGHLCHALVDTGWSCPRLSSQAPDRVLWPCSPLASPESPPFAAVEPLPSGSRRRLPTPVRSLAITLVYTRRYTGRCCSRTRALRVTAIPRTSSRGSRRRPRSSIITSLSAESARSTAGD